MAHAGCTLSLQCSPLSHTLPQLMSFVNSSKCVYISLHSSLIRFSFFFFSYTAVKSSYHIQPLNPSSRRTHSTASLLPNHQTVSLPAIPHHHHRRHVSNSIQRSDSSLCHRPGSLLRTLRFGAQEPTPPNTHRESGYPPTRHQERRRRDPGFIQLSASWHRLTYGSG